LPAHPQIIGLSYESGWMEHFRELDPTSRSFKDFHGGQIVQTVQAIRKPDDSILFCSEQHNTPRSDDWRRKSSQVFLWLRDRIDLISAVSGFTA
jgi:hypothetical protein